MKNPDISILVPVFNEEEVLDAFYNRMTAVLNTLSYTSEILFINDGSSDQTLAKIQLLSSMDKRVCYIDLARNFGKEVALAAGMDYIRGNAVLIIDVDLQHPPELLVDMIVYWEQGFDDVYGRRESRNGEVKTRKALAKLYYRILSRFASVDILIDSGDFRLLSKKAINSFRQFRETERYTKGIFSLIGHNKKCINYSQDLRVAGKTKWSYLKLTNLAVNGITSFSIAPLRMATLGGILFSAVAFVYMIIIMFKTLFWGEVVRGYPSLISLILFFGGLQLFSLGIIGEYLGKAFIESKNRPLYLVNEIYYNTSVKLERELSLN